MSSGTSDGRPSLGDIICHCKGAIRSAEAWKVGRYTWQWLGWCFGRGVTLSDWDYFVENKGRFLVFETKALDAPVSQGQMLALQRLAKLPEFTVVVLWGEKDCPQFMQIVGQPRQRCSRDDVEKVARDWWHGVERLPPAQPRG